VKDNPNNPHWNSILDSHKNKIVWFGWKVYLAVDTESKLPLTITLTPTNKNNGDQA